MAEVHHPPRASAPTTRPGLAHVTVRALLDQAEAHPAGRRRLRAKFLFELMDSARDTPVAGHLRRCPTTGAWMFPLDYAARYMARRGALLVDQHNTAMVKAAKIARPTRVMTVTSTSLPFLS